MTITVLNGEAPFVDEDGLLRHQGRWVTIPDAQLPVARLLLAESMRVVHYDEIARCYATAGGNARHQSVMSMLARLGRRFGAVGIDLVCVRSRGVIVDLGSLSGGGRR